MLIDIISLFPEMLEGFLNASIIARAQRSHLLTINNHQLRQWSTNKHSTVDDRPFGGGAGMLIQPEPIAHALKQLQTPSSKTIYLCPDGIPFSSEIAQNLSQEDHLIFVSGHYEGIDQRIRERYVDMEISIGDYILTNGTLATAVLIDAISRYIPGVLGNEVSLQQDSFSDQLLTFPQYTRPEIFENMGVPEVLLSGNHQAIEKWRQEQRIERTKIIRPDLYQKWLKACQQEEI